MAKKSKAASGDARGAADAPPTGSLAEEPRTKQEIARLSRTILGHVQGIDRMIEEERYCIDILKQVAAVKGMLTRLGDNLSEAHMQHCVREAIEEGEEEEKIKELLETMKYLRSV